MPSPNQPSQSPSPSHAGNSDSGSQHMLSGNGAEARPEARRARGFAAMDASLQRAIASQGGRAAHASGNAHEFDSNEAREAGRKGGEAISRDRSHMARIGAKGGQARGSRRAAAAANGAQSPNGGSEPH